MIWVDFAYTVFVSSIHEKRKLNRLDRRVFRLFPTHIGEANSGDWPRRSGERAMMTGNSMSDDRGYDARYVIGHKAVVDAVDQRFDVVGSQLACLVDVCYRQSGRLSAVDRFRYGVNIQESALDYIVECVRAEFGFTG
jgi:hypothetical protein